MHAARSIRCPRGEAAAAASNDFAVDAVTPKKHIVYSRARNDPNLNLGQFPLVLSSVGKYRIQAIDNLHVNYGVGDIGEDETLTAAERADPNRCQIPNTEARVLEVLEPQLNPATNSVMWIVKVPTISSKAVYGPTGGRKLTIRGTLKCVDATDGTSCLVQVNVASVALRITIKESEAKGVRKRKYDSAYGPTLTTHESVADEATIIASRPYQDLLSRVMQLETLVNQLAQRREIVQI